MLFNSGDLWVLLPQIILVTWASVLLLIVVFIRRTGDGLIPLLTALGLVVTGIFVLPQFSQEQEAFSGMYVVDGFSAFLSLLLILGGLLTVAVSYDYLRRNN